VSQIAVAEVPTERQDPAPEGGAAGIDMRRVGRMGVVLGIAIAVGLRLFVLTHALGALDSDEAVVGLIARQFLRGEHPVFYWGQSYGGTLEAVITAGVFKLFGSSVLALKLVPICLDAIAAVLVWRIGIRLFGRRAGAVAAIAFAVWPATYVWWSTKSRLLGTPLVLGLVMLLCSLRLAERENRWREWLILGLAAGLGWWSQPLIAPLAVAAVVWLALFRWRALRGIWIAAPAAVAGASPWLVWNLRHHFDSLKPPSFPESYVGHLHRFVREALPMALGLRVPYGYRWLPPPLGQALYVAMVAGGAGALVWTAVRYRRTAKGKAAIALGAAIVIYPFFWAISPYSIGTAEGRYLFLLSPLLALVIGLAASRPAVIVGVMAVLLAVTTWGLHSMRTGLDGNDADTPVPVSMGPLIHTLEDRGLVHVFAGYWIAYRLDFESHERIFATPDYGAGRDSRLSDIVRASPNPVYVFATGSLSEREVVGELRSMGVGFSKLTPGKFSVVIPARKVLPEQVPVTG
jgi:4-amino-4-deoxy-L-arabinose transferase-like glycosyltransferase